MKGSVKSALSAFFLVLIFLAAVVGVYLLYLNVNGVSLPFSLPALFGHGSNTEDEFSDEEIEERLLAIGELSTVSFEYADSRTVTDMRQLFGRDIPLTQNRVTVSYEGVVKVSYDLEEIAFSTDREKGVITVVLPEPRITDNYIKFDSIDVESTNNILNPINIDNLASWFDSFQDEAIRRAEEMNIWEEAEDRMMMLVETFLASVSEYEVRFGE